MEGSAQNDMLEKILINHKYSLNNLVSRYYNKRIGSDFQYRHMDIIAIESKSTIYATAACAAGEGLDWTPLLKGTVSSNPGSRCVLVAAAVYIFVCACSCAKR